MVYTWAERTPPIRCRRQLSYNSYVGSADLAAVLMITLGVESDLLAFLKGLEAVSVDCGEVYKYLLAGGIICDEAIAFLCIKPFYCTVIHFGTSFIKVIKINV